jgi:predicted nucleic acid-binding protein
VSGITLDTGALVALERRRARILRLLRGAAARGVPVVVPVAVLTEWWRGRTRTREAILRAIIVEPMTAALALAAGEALAAVPGATAIDAIVVASAARRGDVVLTGDVDDLTRLTAQFPSVRVLRV